MSWMDERDAFVLLRSNAPDGEARSERTPRCSLIEHRDHMTWRRTSLEPEAGSGTPESVRINCYRMRSGVIQPLVLLTVAAIPDD